MAKILAIVSGAALAGLWASAAFAGSLFTPPAACEGFLTVQQKNCEVANYYRCAGSTPGDITVTYSDANGPHYASTIDRETRWMVSQDLEDGIYEYLDADSKDHASFSALLSTGRDDYEFTTTNDLGDTRVFRGYDKLTGETVLIDGMTLERTEFEISAFDADGNFIWKRVGQQYINRDLRLFFAGNENFENAFGDKVDVTDAPIEFVHPGEPGFFAGEPKYGCDMMMTSIASLVLAALR